MICTFGQSPPAHLVNVSIPPKLQKELEELNREHQVGVSEEGDWINLIFSQFPLGDGFSATTSDLLIRVPRSYPDAGPDMFWLDQSLTLAGGQVPQNADSIEGPYAGRKWRRFSWHRKRWNSSVDNIHGHLEFIRRRLREKR